MQTKPSVQLLFLIDHYNYLRSLISDNYCQHFSGDNNNTDHLYYERTDFAIWEDWLCNQNKSLEKNSTSPKLSLILVNISNNKWEHRDIVGQMRAREWNPALFGQRLVSFVKGVLHIILPFIKLVKFFSPAVLQSRTLIGAHQGPHSISLTTLHKQIRDPECIEQVTGSLQTHTTMLKPGLSISPLETKFALCNVLPGFPSLHLYRCSFCPPHHWDSNVRHIGAGTRESIPPIFNCWTTSAWFCSKWFIYFK